MFAESLLESSGRMHTRRGWTMLFSIGLQLLALAIAILAPMLVTPHGPLQALTPFSVPLMNPTIKTPPVRQPVATRNEHPSTTVVEEHVFEQPPTIPKDIVMTEELPRRSAASQSICITCNVAGPPNTDSGLKGPPGGTATAPAVKPKDPEPPRRVPVSVVQLGQLINKVQPVYPTLCRQMRCQGQVVLQAVINQQGEIESLRVVSSAHPMLQQAALEAVRRWRYKPYMLNGEAVEVETQITVNFTLGQ